MSSGGVGVFRMKGWGPKSSVCPLKQKNIRNPNHHYFSKKYRNTPSNLYCDTPPICIAVASVPLHSEERENIVSTPPICIAVRLPFVSQYASHSYRSTFGKILVVVVAGLETREILLCFASPYPFCSSRFHCMALLPLQPCTRRSLKT